MRFFLFVVANAMLFIRPSELVPELGDVELYRYFIIACLIVGLPVIIQQLFTRCAGVPPVAGCVLGLFPAVVLSHVSQGNADEALDQGIEFFKVLVYFLLLLGLLTTTTKLRQFLYWLVLFCAALAAVAVLRYHADLGAPAPPPKKTPAENPEGKNVGVHGTSVKEQVRDEKSGELVDVNRMCGTGIFNDPNDLALVLITAIPLCLYWLTDPKRKAARPLWIAVLMVLGYALALTYSRGGFLALLAGLLVMFQVRFGGKKSLGLALLVLPLLFLVFAGRMTSISASEGTGQSRIQLWSDGLTFFQQAPFFGIGMDGYSKVSRHVAHNSYIHCYAELGLFGGTLFLGAFYFALRGLYSARPDAEDPDEPEVRPGAAVTPPPESAELRRLHPYLLAMLVSYAVGIAFLSRSYIVPTYLLLGLAVAFMRLRAAGTVTRTPAWCKLVLPRLIGISFCFLIASYTFVRLFVNWQ
jgi:hypothetical protein